MKKIIPIIALLFMAACSNGGENMSGTDTSAVRTSDTISRSADTGNMSSDTGTTPSGDTMSRRDTTGM